MIVLFANILLFSFFCSSSHFSNAVLESMVKACGRTLEKLLLTSCSAITDQGLKAVARECSKLRYVFLSLLSPSPYLCCTIFVFPLHAFLFIPLFLLIYTGHFTEISYT